MTIERIDELLTFATEYTIKVAREYTSNRLPDKVRYLVRTNGKIDYHEALDRRGLLSKIWTDGSIPDWVDLGVHSCDDDFTYIGVEYSENRVVEESSCVYSKRKQGPFGIKSPVLPSGWKSLNESGRFAILRRPTF